MPSKFLFSARAPGREPWRSAPQGVALPRRRASATNSCRSTAHHRRRTTLAGRCWPHRAAWERPDWPAAGREVSVLQSERYLQSPLLRLRKLSYESQQRSTQLLHPCVWKLHLQFGTTDVENAKIRGRRGHMGQQRRLCLSPPPRGWRARRSDLTAHQQAGQRFCPAPHGAQPTRPQAGHPSCEPCLHFNPHSAACRWFPRVHYPENAVWLGRRALVEVSRFRQQRRQNRSRRV